MLSILVVDDQAILRRGLRQILKEEVPALTLGEAADADEALRALAGRKWDLMLLDVSLPGRGGLDLLKEVRQQRRPPAVLMMSVYPEAQFAVRALKAGAAGYLTKDAAPEEVITAVRRIVSGGRYLSPALAERLADMMAGSDRPPHETLSDRELHVLCLLGAGRAVGQIARDLRVSVKTISTYRQRVLTKMGLHSTAELVRYAVEHQLVWR